MSRSRFAVGMVVVLVLGLGVVVGLRYLERGGYLDRGADSSEPAPVAVRKAATVVNEQGFRLELDGVVVEGGPGVAPPGTKARARLIAPPRPARLPEPFASIGGQPAGPAVRVLLGGNRQPERPITLTFTQPGSLNTVIARSGDRAEFAVAERSDDAVVVRTDHLTDFFGWLAPVDRFGDWLGEQLMIAMGIRSDKPDCVARTAERWTVEGIGQELLWPCVETRGDGSATVTFTNNSPEVWSVRATEPAGVKPGTPGASTATGVLMAALGLQFVERSSTVPVVTGGHAGFQVSALGAGERYRFRVEQMAVLTAVNALIGLVERLVPAGKVKTILDRLGKADCMGNLVTSTVSAERVPLTVVSSIVNCLGSVVEGLTGALLTAVGAIPGGAVGVLMSLLRKLGRWSTMEVEITQRAFEAPSSGLSFVVPAQTCGAGNGGGAWQHPDPIRLRNGTGEASFHRDGMGASVVESGAVGQADFNGDGIDDVVVWIACSGSRIAMCCAGRGSIDHRILVYDVSLPSPRPLAPVIISTNPPGGEGEVSGRQFYGPEATLDGTTIVTEQRPIYDDGPATGTVRHDLVDGAWRITE